MRTVFKVVWMITFVGFVSAAGVYAAQTHKSKFVPFKPEVTKRDTRGRVQVMRALGSEGTCVAEVVYDQDHPRIYVLALSGRGARNLGYLQINDGTEAGLSNMVLMRNFKKAIRERCLPLIVPGSLSM